MSVYFNQQRRPTTRGGYSINQVKLTICRKLLKDGGAEPRAERFLSGSGDNFSCGHAEFSVWCGWGQAGPGWARPVSRVEVLGGAEGGGPEAEGRTHGGQWTFFPR